MHGPEARRQATAAIRRTLTLVLLAATSLGILACAETASKIGPATPTPPLVQPLVSKAKDIAATRRQELGDYDDDEWTGSSDNDGDDKPTVDGDGDLNDGHGRYDADDRSFRAFGHIATPRERHAIIALVKSYYAIAARGDGASACALIYVPLARNYPEELGEFGPRYLHGLKTCPAILSRMFEPNRLLLRRYRARLQVEAVRVAGGIGIAFLTFKGLPTRKMEVIKEGGRWKMYAALDSELP